MHISVTFQHFIGVSHILIFCLYSCLDCSHPEYRILRNDNNISWNTYALEAPSFQQWLQALLDGTLEFDWDKTEKVTL
jgi:hypothetical protein